jgi:hypothetical protein
MLEQQGKPTVLAYTIHLTGPCKLKTTNIHGKPHVYIEADDADVFIPPQQLKQVPP